MTIIELTVKGTDVKSKVLGPLTEGMVGARVVIRYDDAWAGLSKTLVCRSSLDYVPGSEIRTVANVGTEATVAHEVMVAGRTLYLGIEGRSADGTEVFPTIWARCGEIQAGANVVADPTVAATPEVWEQILAQMGSLDGLNTAEKGTLVAAINEAMTKGNGLPGKDGRGISSIEGNEDGSWIIAYTDDTTETISSEAYQALAEQVNQLSEQIAEKEQLTPEFANVVDECTETGKLYVLPDGYIYAYYLDTESEETEGEWRSTGLRLAGEDGVGIASITTVHWDSLNATMITVTMTDGTSSVFTIPDGESGKSAYDYAVEAGYEGTEEEFAEQMAVDTVALEDEVDYLSETVKSELLSPVYATDPVEPSSLVIGGSHNNVAVTEGMDETKLYGLAIFPVEEGCEYHICAKQNASLPALCVGDTEVTSGNIVNPVALRTDKAAFVAPKTGYLYVNIIFYSGQSDYCALEKVVDYVPRCETITGRNLSIPFDKLSGYGVAIHTDGLSGNQMGILEENENVSTYISQLEPGTYYFFKPSFVLGGAPTQGKYRTVLLTAAAGTTHTVHTACYSVSIYGAVTQVVDVDESSMEDAERAEETLARIGEVRYQTGDEVAKYGAAYGIFDYTNPQKVNSASSTYQMLYFQVEKDKKYVLTCDNFSYPMNSYNLYGFACFAPATIESNIYCIPGSAKTASGAFAHVITAPIDGYLYVSNWETNPSDIHLYVAESASLLLSTSGKAYQKLLTVGDSLSGNTNLWQPKLISLLGIPEYEVAGGAGLTLADQGTDVNTIYNRVMALEEDESIDLITIWGGFNDFNSGIVIGSLEEQINPDTRDATTFIGGALDCVEKLLTLHPQAQFVLIGTTPFNFYATGKDWCNWTNGKGYKIADFVDALRLVAEYYSLPFLDLLHNSGFNEYNYATYFQDQGYWLHPNTAGNERLAYQIAGFIKSLS